MKIKLTRTIAGHKLGDTIDVTDAGGRKLIDLGTGEEVKTESKPAPKRQRKTKTDETSTN